MSNLLELTEAFYEAAWDFSTRLCLLPDQLTSCDDPDIVPDKIISTYKEEIEPFLNLDGNDLPRAYYVPFDQIHTTMNTEVFPALEVLTEEWNELVNHPESITKESKLAFAEKSTYISNLIEMYVISQTLEIRDELRLAYT